MALVKTKANKKNKHKIVGKVQMTPLSSIKPNPWNPNQLTPFEKESLKFGFRKDGWLASHAMTIWGSDEDGVVKDIIIDGEHRWKAALDLGMVAGPAVRMEGLTEVQAKSLTIKLDAKRGKFQEESLKKLLQSIAEGLDLETRSLDLGLNEDLLAGYLMTAEEAPHITGELPAGQTSTTKQVQLFFTPENHAEFTTMAKKLAVHFRTDNMADTVMQALKSLDSRSEPPPPTAFALGTSSQFTRME